MPNTTVEGVRDWICLAYALISEWLHPETGEQRSMTVFEAAERLRQHGETCGVMEAWPRKLQQSRARAALEQGKRDGRFSTFLGKGKHLSKETQRYELSERYLNSLRRAEAWAKEVSHV